MIRLTKKTEYALLALAHIGQPDEESIFTAREIAEHCQIPFPIMAKVMQHLSRTGILEPVQGARGGYKLRVSLADVNLWQFLDEMEGPLGITDCFVDTSCIQMGSCSIRTPMRTINDTVRSMFNRISLLDVTDPEGSFNEGVLYD